MRALTGLFILVFAACLLAGCAGVSEQRSPTVKDSRYISAVEHKARMQGVEVMWVNPPRKTRRKSEDSDVTNPGF